MRRRKQGRASWKEKNPSPRVLSAFPSPLCRPTPVNTNCHLPDEDTSRLASTSPSRQGLVDFDLLLFAVVRCVKLSDKEVLKHVPPDLSGPTGPCVMDDTENKKTCSTQTTDTPSPDREKPEGHTRGRSHGPVPQSQLWPGPGPLARSTFF